MKIKLKDGMFFHWSPQSIVTSVVSTSALITMFKKNIANDSLVELINSVMLQLPLLSILIQLLFSVKNEESKIHPKAYEWVAKIIILSMVMSTLQIVNKMDGIEMKSPKAIGA